MRRCSRTHRRVATYFGGDGAGRCLDGVLVTGNASMTFEADTTISTLATFSRKAKNLAADRRNES